MVPRSLHLPNRNNEIPRVLDLKAQIADAIVQPGDSQRRRSHVHAPSLLSQVEGDADDLHCTLLCSGHDVARKTTAWIVAFAKCCDERFSAARIVAECAARN